MAKKMTLKKAIKIAIDAIKSERQKIAFDANMRKSYSVSTPHAVKSLAQHDEYSAAIELLERIQNGSIFIQEGFTSKPGADGNGE